MSQTTTVVATDQDALPAHESDSLWTADSERSPIQTSDPVPVTEPTPLEPAAADVAPESETVIPPADEAGKRRSGKPRNDPDARVKAATAKEAAAKEEARLAREEATRVRAELDALRKPATSQPAQPQQPAAQPDKFTFPKFEQWLAQHPNGDYEDYNDAKLDAREAFRESREAVTRVWNQHGARIDAAIAADPAFKDVIQTQTPVLREALAGVGLGDLPQTLTLAMTTSTQGPQFFRYLLTHPADAAQLARTVGNLPPSPDAVRLVQHLLTTATTAVALPDSAPVVRPSAAKPPVSRVGGAATATPASADDLEFGPEFMRAMNREDKARKEAGRW